MPATGDRITKRKDGLFQGMYTAQTPDGPKRKYIYGRRKKDVETKLAAARGDAARGIVFDAKGQTVGEWLELWLEDTVRPDETHRTFTTHRHAHHPRNRPDQAGSSTQSRRGPALCRVAPERAGAV